MAATRADLIVVGAGLAGSAAAWAAAERGMDVVVLEAFQPGHRNGSSHGSARIFRRAYPDPLYVRLTAGRGPCGGSSKPTRGSRCCSEPAASTSAPAGTRSNSTRC